MTNKRKSGPKVKNYFNFKNDFIEVLEYLGNSTWKCKCKCGEIFKARTNTIEKRKGCRSCTASIVSAKKNKKYNHFGYVNRLFKEYRDGAIKRGLSFEIGFDYFYNTIQGNCKYCNEPPKICKNKYTRKTGEPFERNGIDRIDSSKGYTEENTCTCCSKCNYAKHEMTLKEFKKWIVKLYKNLIK